MKPLARLPLGPWRPDQAVRGAEGVLADVRNAIWAGSHWQPQPRPAPMSSIVLQSPVQGIFTTSRLDGTTELFVVAAGRWYRLVSRSIVDDLTTTAFSPAATVRWRAVQFGDLLIAVNFENETQAYDLVGGGDMYSLPEAPRARYIAIVRDFPVVAHTWTTTDQTNSYQVRWPGFVDGVVDPTEWTPALETQAGFQQVSDIGQIQGLTGGQFGTIIGESGVTVMQYGADLWDFSTPERRLGTRVPNSVVQYRQNTYFWSPDGFMSFDGQSVRAIGSNKLDDWFADDFDETLGHRMWAHVEARSGRVRWLYPGRGHNGTLCNRLLSYSPAYDDFSVADIEGEAMGPGKTFGLSLDDPEFDNNLDTFQGSLDDPALWDEQTQTAIVNGSLLQALTGEPLVPLFEPSEWQADPSKRALLTRALVGHDGGVPNVRVGRVEILGEPPSWSPQHPRQPDGWFRFREPGRSHRFRVSLAGSWQRAQWLDVFGASLGGR